MELYTIADMAKLLKIPESTARYYRDRHPEYFHYTGKGYKKRYTPETLEALRFICEQANNSRRTAEEQQLRLVETLTTTLREISDQKKDIQDLRDEIKELREYIKTPVLKRIFKRGE